MQAGTANPEWRPLAWSNEQLLCEDTLLDGCGDGAQLLLALHALEPAHQHQQQQAEGEGQGDDSTAGTGGEAAAPRPVQADVARPLLPATADRPAFQLPAASTHVGAPEDGVGAAGAAATEGPAVDAVSGKQPLAVNASPEQQQAQHAQQQPPEQPQQQQQPPPPQPGLPDSPMANGFAAERQQSWNGSSRGGPLQKGREEEGDAAGVLPGEHQASKQQAKDGELAVGAAEAQQAELQAGVGREQVEEQPRQNGPQSGTAGTEAEVGAGAEAGPAPSQAQLGGAGSPSGGAALSGMQTSSGESSAAAEAALTATPDTAGAAAPGGAAGPAWAEAVAGALAGTGCCPGRLVAAWQLDSLEELFPAGADLAALRQPLQPNTVVLQFADGCYLCPAPVQQQVSM